MIDDYRKKREKGNSLTCIPKSYVVVDIETTGLDSRFDDIIEVGALKVNNFNIVEEFQTLIQPPSFEEMNDEGEFEKFYVSDFITELTGITNEMLENAPKIDQVIPGFIDFIGGDILVGHNIHFDLNFLYDISINELNHRLNNDFMDLLKISRRVFPELKNHKLSTVAEHLKVNTDGSHRSLKDCSITHWCTVATYDHLTRNSIGLEEMFKRVRNRAGRSKLDLTKIEATTDEINPDNIFCGQNITFTGTLERMKRSDAAQLVADMGGKCQNGVTKKTNFLILGNLEYSVNVKGNKSTKLKKAEDLILKGQELRILSENVFYDMLEID